MDSIEYHVESLALDYNFVLTLDLGNNNRFVQRISQLRVQQLRLILVIWKFAYFLLILFNNLFLAASLAATGAKKNLLGFYSNYSIFFYCVKKFFKISKIGEER